MDCLAATIEPDRGHRVECAKNTLRHPLLNYQRVHLLDVRNVHIDHTAADLANLSKALCEVSRSPETVSRTRHSSRARKTLTLATLTSPSSNWARSTWSSRNRLPTLHAGAQAHP